MPVCEFGPYNRPIIWGAVVADSSAAASCRKAQESVARRFAVDAAAAVAVAGFDFPSAPAGFPECPMPHLRDY